MRRRALLLAGAAALAVSPAAAAADNPRIGLVHTGSRQENQRVFDAFRAGLAELGWADSGNVVILDRWAEDQGERLPGLVAELIAARAAVLVTGGSQATRAATAAGAKIPIVMVGVDDPVARGFVDSLARPGGNVTGLSLNSSRVVGERLRLLTELLPRLRRLAVIVREDPGLEQKLLEIRSDAARMGITALMLEAATGRAVDLAFARLHSERCEAIYLASGPLGPAKRSQIIARASEARLPAIYSFRVFPLAGGLMSFAADYDDLFGRAAGFVDKILRGADPADLPVEPPRKFDLTVNLKTARALGLTVPQSIRARADEVIE